MPSERVRAIQPSATLRISDQAREMRASGVDVLDLSAGQPDFPTPAEVKLAGIRAIEQDRTRYTANVGLEELRQAIAASLEREHGASYGLDQVIVSPGAKASLYFAFLTLLDPGDEALVPSPYWVSYPEQIRLAGATPIFLPCDEGRGFKLDPAELERAITERTRLLVLNSPSNPTGACYSREELEPIAEICVRRGVWIVSDEIYARLLFDGRSYCGIASLGEAIRGRSVTINGMSKTWSMTGWRIGYAAGPREIISGMARLQSHSTSNATSISQWASVAALQSPGDELQRRVVEFQRRRDRIVARLEALDGVSCVLPEGAFYAFPNVSSLFRKGGPQSASEVAELLLERAGVALVPGEAFGSGNHVRVSFATSVERIEEAMDRIERALATSG